MSDDRAYALRARIDGLSDAQRYALAERLREAGKGPALERLVAFLVLDGSASPPTDDELRAVLAERLPDYMIPSRFVVLDRLPRTAAGKLDRRALAHVTGTELSADVTRQGPTAPRSDLETKLVAIWKDVLKVDDVGVDDDFFEIGGDSLLSIRVIARAGREGIRITPERFFERPTIAHIAASIGAGTARAGANGARAPIADPIGDAPLTPIQHWFLEAVPHHRDRWNQSYLLELGHPLDTAQVSAIMRALVTHHDALRLRLTHRSGQWRQEFAAPDEDIPVRVVALNTLPASEYAGRVAEECEKEHADLRLEDGKLFRCVVFDGHAGWRRILLLGHHLVLDNVSWSVILDDLATLVGQAVGGQTLRLPENTAPPRAWAIALAERAAASDVAQWAAHWLTMPADDTQVPVDMPAAASTGSRAELAGCNHDAEVLTITLGEEESRLVVQQAPRRMDASVQAVLLAALLLAWRDWTGNDSLRLDIEGHGRGVLGDTVDVSRTVGWFTTVFPVHLALPRDLGNGAQPPADMTVTAVKRALDALPLRGAAHGLARYLAPDESTRSALAAHSRPAVLFNHLGAHDVTLPPASRLRVTDEPQGLARSADAPRPYLLEINSRIEHGVLLVAIEYSRRAHSAATIERFAAALRSALGGIARGSSMQFGLPGVDASSLAIVADLLADLDDA